MAATAFTLKHRGKMDRVGFVFISRKICVRDIRNIYTQKEEKNNRECLGRFVHSLDTFKQIYTIFKTL